MLAAWQSISQADVSSIEGFGDFDSEGRAPARSWREVLEATLERVADLAEARAAPLPDLEPALERYRSLIRRCPEERALVHGDFGSNNVLVDGTRISAVLDWENAMVGDPFYDVANTRFWATHLRCMELQAEHFDRTLSHVAGYRERVLCYALRIGLEEARGAVAHADSRQAAWAVSRCFELLEADG